MAKCGCERGDDCTKTTVCQCAYTADVLAEALEDLLAACYGQAGVCAATSEAMEAATDALEEYKA